MGTETRRELTFEGAGRIVIDMNFLFSVADGAGYRHLQDCLMCKTAKNKIIMAGYFSAGWLEPLGTFFTSAHLSSLTKL
jgi:hypothetical protein